MSESKVIANQKTIIANQAALRANQTTIKKNQATLLKNQASILKNQGALNTILENQRKILARLNKGFAPQGWLITFATKWAQKTVASQSWKKRWAGPK